MLNTKKISLLLLLGFLIVFLSSCGDSSEFKDFAVVKTFHWFFYEITPKYWGFLDQFFSAGTAVGTIFGIVLAIVMAVVYIASLILLIAIFAVLLVIIIVVAILGGIASLFFFFV